MIKELFQLTIVLYGGTFRECQVLFGETPTQSDIRYSTSDEAGSSYTDPYML